MPTTSVTVTPPNDRYHRVRRVPRGGTGRSDPLTRIGRMAAAHRKRIRGMMQSVKYKNDRSTLRVLKARLITILRLISDSPEEVRSGTFYEVNSVMAEARTLYAKAAKLDGRRRRKRDPEANGEGANAKPYDGTEPGEKRGGIELSDAETLTNTKNEGGPVAPSAEGLNMQARQRRDPLAFDPEAGRSETVDVALSGPQLSASMAAAGSNGDEAAFNK